MVPNLSPGALDGGARPGLCGGVQLPTAKLKSLRVVRGGTSPRCVVRELERGGVEGEVPRNSLARSGLDGGTRFDAAKDPRVAGAPPARKVPAFSEGSEAAAPRTLGVESKASRSASLGARSRGIRSHFTGGTMERGFYSSISED